MKSNPKKLTEDNNHTLEEEQTKHKTLKIKQLETARLQTIGNSTIEYNSSNLKRRQNNALTLTNINIRNNSYNFKCRKERCNNWNLPTVSEPLTLINPTTQPPYHPTTATTSQKLTQITATQQTTAGRFSCLY